MGSSMYYIFTFFSTLLPIVIIHAILMPETAALGKHLDPFVDIFRSLKPAGDEGKFFSYMNSTSYMDGGNSTLGSKRAAAAGLSHLFHSNSSLVPAGCDSRCVQRIHSNRIMQHLRANLGVQKLSVANRANYIWLNAQKLVEWFVEVAITSLAIPNPQVVRLVPDTGSFFTWFQCKSCRRCYPQRTRLFNPLQNGNTFRYLTDQDDLCQRVQRTPYGQGMGPASCDYYAYYMDTTSSVGLVVSDTFRFYSMDGTRYIFIPGLAFGCGLDNHAGTGTGMSGVLGLARLKGVSLPEQGVRWLGQSFAYCLPIVGSAPDAGWITFGDDSMPDPARDASYSATTLASGGHEDTLYLDAIDMLVNGYRVYVPPGIFDINPDKSGGVVLDSGSMMSSFMPAAYYPFRDAYRTFMLQVLGRAQLTGKFGFDTCWDISNIDPNQLNLPTIGYLLRDGQQFMVGSIASYFQYQSRSGRPMFCLPFLPIDTGDEKSSSVSGYSMMQTHMAYKYATNELIWANGKC